MYKRFRFMCVFMILAGILCLPISAFTETVPKVQINGPERVTHGQIITVTAAIRDNVGLCACLFDLTWDATQLSYIENSMTMGEVLKGGNFFCTSSEEAVKANWYDLKDHVKNGQLFSCRFRVIADEVGQTGLVAISFSRQNTINISEQEVEITPSPYQYSVIGPTTQSASSATTVSAATTKSTGTVTSVSSLSSSTQKSEKTSSSPPTEPASDKNKGDSSGLIVWGIIVMLSLTVIGLIVAFIIEKSKNRKGKEK